MSKNLSKKEIDKFSRQIILKNIGPLGQKKILDSKVLIIGMGGLGCPAADFLTRSGIGKLGIVDHDTVSLSNIHRQSLVTGAISKFDGHVFTFDFKDKKTPSLKNFYQEKEISDDIFNCEFDGVLGTTATIVGTTQANEALKLLMEIGKNLKNQILIIDLIKS